MLEKFRSTATQIGQIIVGKTLQIRQSLTCLLAGGHLLIEDVPGVGKTTLAHAIAISLGLPFRRIQFTSDLLPADVIGVSVYERNSGQFVFHPGPIFTAGAAGRRDQPRHAQRRKARCSKRWKKARSRSTA